MFWIPSNKPLDFDWLQGSVRRLKAQLAAMPWLSAVQELGAGLKERPLFFLPLLLLIAALLWWRKKIDAERTSVVQGKSVSVRVVLGGHPIITQTKTYKNNT